MHIRTLELINELRRRKRPVVLVTFLDSGEQVIYVHDDPAAGGNLSNELTTLAVRALTTDQCLLTEDASVFYQPFNTPLRLIIIGAVHISIHLAAMAQHCDYQVTIVDPRTAFASAQRFPEVTLVTDWPDAALAKLAPDARSAVVTLTHDPKLDDPALHIALQSDAFYIGALGSRKTQQARQQRLAEHGFSDAQQARIHGPIGLDIGARSPAEIAVAIMAQVTSALHSGSS